MPFDGIVVDIWNDFCMVAVKYCGSLLFPEDRTKVIETKYLEKIDAWE
jgi:hypothetical protein